MVMQTDDLLLWPRDSGAHRLAGGGRLKAVVQLEAKACPKAYRAQHAQRICTHRTQPHSYLSPHR